MSKEISASQSALLIVYCVVRYGQLIGVYSNYDDAVEVLRVSIAKGQVCDLIPKPVISSSKSI